MPTFRDVQNVIVERAVRATNAQLRTDALANRALARQGGIPAPTGAATSGVLRADDLPLGTPGAGLAE